MDFPPLCCVQVASEGRFCSSSGFSETPVPGWTAKTYPLVYGSFVPDAGERQPLSLPKVCAKLQGGPCLRAGCPSRRPAVLSKAAIGVV